MFFGPRIQEIDATELKQWLADKAGTFRIIDVRTPQEIAAGSIPGAVAMPLTTVPLRLSELKPDETLVFICRSGQRSGQACQFLQQQGFDQVYNLRGGVIAWAGSGGEMVPLSQAD